MKLSEKQLFWLVLLIIIGVSAVPRFMTYDFGLPYIENSVEPNYYLAGLDWRGGYDDGGYYAWFPPAYIAVNWLTQTVGAPFGLSGAAEVVRVLRFVGVLVNLATLVFIALTAREIAGKFAGWIAGLSWGVSPIVVTIGFYATPDPWVFLWVSIALWLAVVAGKQKRYALAVFSVFAGVIAIFFKYPVLSAVGPGLIVGAFIAYRERKFRVLAMQLGVIAISAPFLLMLLSGANEREAAAAKASGLGNLLTPSRVFNNLYHAFVPLNAVCVLVIIGVGMAAYFYALHTQRDRVNPLGVILCSAIIITIPWLAATFSVVKPNLRMKDVLPATTAVSIILGAAVVQIHAVLSKWLRPYPSAGLLTAVLLVLVVPQGIEVAGIVRDRRLPEARVAIRRWVDENLDPGTILVTLENDSTFNPVWGGVQGQHWYDWIRIDAEEIRDNTVTYYREERGISYAVLPRWYVELQMQSAEGQAFLDQLLLMKTFYSPPEMRGPESAVFRLQPVQNSLVIGFGEQITLIGYDSTLPDVQPGGTVSYLFYWNAHQLPDENYSLFMHLMPADRVDVITQADGNPASHDRLTMTWGSPTETLVSSPFVLNIPPELTPGVYRVMIGLYNFETGARLPVVLDGQPAGDAYQLAVITVTE